MAKFDLNKHIWEGWTVQDFVDELRPQLDYMFEMERMRDEPFMTKSELKNWCKDNQPYYKKHIPDVVNYFIDRYKIKK